MIERILSRHPVAVSVANLLDKQSPPLPEGVESVKSGALAPTAGVFANAGAPIDKTQMAERTNSTVLLI
jgi:hypothetical protein